MYYHRHITELLHIVFGLRTNDRRSNKKRQLVEIHKLTLK
jgi:hypothetical protein